MGVQRSGIFWAGARLSGARRGRGVDGVLGGGGRRALLGMVRTDARISSACDTELRRPRTPVALDFGAADRIVSVAQGRDLARRMPNAHVREVPGEGHLLIVARLGEILDALETAARGGTKPEIAPSPRTRPLWFAPVPV